MTPRSPVDVHPASADEIRAVFGEVPFRMRAFAATVDGEVIALGGLAFLEGRVMAFVDVRDEERYREYPVSLHRTARKVLAEAKVKHRSVFAEQGKTETSRRWLKRLGFSPVDSEETVLILCQH